MLEVEDEKFTVSEKNPESLQGPMQLCLEKLFFTKIYALYINHDDTITSIRRAWRRSMFCIGAEMKQSVKCDSM